MISPEIPEKEPAPEEIENPKKGEGNFPRLDDSEDHERINDAKLINDAINHGFAFNPEKMFKDIVQGYRPAEDIEGESFLVRLTGYSRKYIKKNINLPEFRRELKDIIDNKMEDLKDKKLLDPQNGLTEKAVDLASMVLYTEELEKLRLKGIGEHEKKKDATYGELHDTKKYSKGDAYHRLDVRATVRSAARRKHKKVSADDLHTGVAQSRGKIEIIYAIDCSGSMKGTKLENAKKAGVALAFRALDRKDKVGLLLFRKGADARIRPGKEFDAILRMLASESARGETGIAEAIDEAAALFSNSRNTRHIVLISDAMPNAGTDPEEETIESAGRASAAGITISVVGISLKSRGRTLAKEISEIGRGRLYHAVKPVDLDLIVLEDYESLKEEN